MITTITTVLFHLIAFLLTIRIVFDFSYFVLKSITNTMVYFSLKKKRNKLEEYTDVYTDDNFILYSLCFIFNKRSAKDEIINGIASFGLSVYAVWLISNTGSLSVIMGVCIGMLFTVYSYYLCIKKISYQKNTMIHYFKKDNQVKWECECNSISY